MKLAVICSAGGAAFFAAFDMLAKANRYTKNDFIVITDRACGAEKEADVRDIEYHRVIFKSKEQFAMTVADLLAHKGVSIMLMLYSRLIASNLYLALPTLNIHPALLPAFKGINAAGQAADAGVKFIGATLHVVTEEMDDGAIVAQVVSPIRFNASREQLDNISFLQKTYLIVATLDCLYQNILQLTGADFEVHWTKETKFSGSANPCIQSNDLKDIFNAYQKAVNIGNVIQ